METKDIGLKVKKYRLNANLSQFELENLINTSTLAKKNAEKFKELNIKV